MKTPVGQTPGLYREEKWDITLPWQQHFWITTMGSLSNNNSDSKKERPKSNQFILAELQLCICITLFCTFLSRHCKSATWNLLISLASFMELVSTAQNFLFLFLFVDQIRSFQVQPQTISPRFYKLNKTEYKHWWSLKQCKLNF